MKPNSPGRKPGPRQAPPVVRSDTDDSRWSAKDRGAPEYYAKDQRPRIGKPVPGKPEPPTG